MVGGSSAGRSSFGGPARAVASSASAFDVDIREIDRDFKRVDGVELPMAIERDPKGRIPQVWRIARYELNPKGFDKAFREPASRGVS